MLAHSIQARLPRVTFGVRAFNGEPFLRYNLRALYPFAHEIIVVEGALSDTASLATTDGHSTDGTLDTLHRFKEQEDPDDKLQIVRRDGFWRDAEEQSRAAAERASGDYLWIVDVDEFYQPADMRKILRMLLGDSTITAVLFKQITFWGGFDYVADGWYLSQRQGEGPGIVLRLFRWGPGYRYVAHRPLTIHDQDGRDLLMGKVLGGVKMAGQGIFMYHYSLVFPLQVREKCAHYSRAEWARTPRMDVWAEEAFMRLGRPFRVHNVYKYPSWLERFEGRHPNEIEALRSDIAKGQVSVKLRPTEDVERLLRSRMYRVGRAILKALDPFARYFIRLRRRLKRRLVRRSTTG
ncbi:MAG: glycosyltransferase [Rhodothermales bacterium]